MTEEASAPHCNETPDEHGGAQPPGANLVAFVLRIDPAHIVWLKFILESYEGLGIIRTIDRSRGDIAVLAVEDTAEDVRALLASLHGQPSGATADDRPCIFYCQEIGRTDSSFGERTTIPASVSANASANPIRLPVGEGEIEDWLLSEFPGILSGE